MSSDVFPTSPSPTMTSFLRTGRGGGELGFSFDFGFILLPLEMIIRRSKIHPSYSQDAEVI